MSVVYDVDVESLTGIIITLYLKSLSGICGIGYIYKYITAVASKRKIDGRTCKGGAEALIHESIDA